MFNLITSVFCVVFLSWPYSGAASDHNKSHIRSHHRTSIWQFYHNQVWSKGQPTPWVSGINTEPYCRDWKKKINVTKMKCYKKHLCPNTDHILVAVTDTDGPKTAKTLSPPTWPPVILIAPMERWCSAIKTWSTSRVNTDATPLTN